MLERGRELERIGACLRRAREGRGGAIAAVGPAGIGKSLLLAAGRDLAEREGFRVLRARGGELEREFAFGLVRQLVEPLVVAASAKQQSVLFEGPPGVAARLLGFPGFGDGAPTTTQLNLDPSFAVLHGLYWLCANLAAERPLALVVDDVHWADGASLRFLAFLLPRLEELPVAVLLGARPAESEECRELLAALGTDLATELIAVSPLSVRGVGSLVGSGLGVEPDPVFALACWEATGGTPFLVSTLVDALREEGIAPVSTAAHRVPNVATETLDRWAMLRLARLGAGAARLARAVAVLERAELEQAAGLARLTLTDAAIAADLLVRAGVLNDAPLCFAHPLLRSAVYRDLGIAERAGAHDRAARILAETLASSARVAEHLLATIPAGDCWAVEQLRAAARDAASRGAPESAVSYLRRAVVEPPRPEAVGGILLELGVAEFTAGEQGWHERLAAAVESADDAETQIAATLLFANALRWHGRLGEAVQLCDRVAANLDGRDTEGHLVLDAMAIWCGIVDAAVAPSMVDRTAALLMRSRERSVPRNVLVVAAFVAALTNEPADQVAGLALRAIGPGTRALPEPGEPPWFHNAVAALHFAERYDEAQLLLYAAVAQAEASANETIPPVVLAQRAWVAFRRSDLTAAEADARVLLEAPGFAAQALPRSLANAVLIDVLVERGDLEEAERIVEPATAGLVGTSLAAPMLRHARGRVRFAQGRFGEALGDFQDVGAIAAAGLAISPCWLPWRSDAALAARALGDTDTAQRLSYEELALARVFGAPRTLGVALRAAGIVCGGERGEALLREAVDTLAGPDTKLEQARVLADLGAVLRRGNRRSQARDLLRQSLDLADHLGATRLAKRAETELRATGAKPRRVRLTGLDALTASERRIAELAAQGMTNREIAQTLYITSRTVEGHLTNVFSKLEVNTRTRLPAVLAPVEMPCGQSYPRDRLNSQQARGRSSGYQDDLF
jgi:DNA-binding CsgD family transcriptional regulator